MLANVSQTAWQLTSRQQLGIRQTPRPTLKILATKDVPQLVAHAVDVVTKHFRNVRDLAGPVPEAPNLHDDIDARRDWQPQRGEGQVDVAHERHRLETRHRVTGIGRV